jgi:hypothetical protein
MLTATKQSTAYARTAMIRDISPIFIVPTVHQQLTQVANDTYNAEQTTAAFLAAEPRRAVVSERITKACGHAGQLGGATQISLLSPIGIALLGMRRGDTMQVVVPEVGFQTLHVATVVHPEEELEYSLRHWTGN